MILQVPGNIRRAEHFMGFLRRFIEYLRQRLNVSVVETETPATFLANLQEKVAIEGMSGCNLSACRQHAEQTYACASIKVKVQ